MRNNAGFSKLTNLTWLQFDDGVAHELPASFWTHPRLAWIYMPLLTSSFSLSTLPTTSGQLFSSIDIHLALPVGRYRAPGYLLWGAAEGTLPGSLHRAARAARVSCVVRAHTGRAGCRQLPYGEEDGYVFVRYSLTTDQTGASAREGAVWG